MIRFWDRFEIKNKTKIIIIIIEISYSKASLRRWPTRRSPMVAHCAYRKNDTRNDEILKNY